MSEAVILGKSEDIPAKERTDVQKITPQNSQMPTVSSLESGLMEASRLVDDIILKKYLHNLTNLEVIPLNDSLKQISDIRIFKVTEMVYQKDEYSTYKFASVFNAVQNLNCGIFIIADSDGSKTEFYMGVRSLDDKRTTKSLKDTLKNALCGQFPGVKTEDILDPDAESFLANISDRNIAVVSCVANNKDEDFKDNQTFLQGLEKLALAMQGQKYTAVILAKSTSAEQLDEIRTAYETIYTQLSPFTNMQLSYGSNTALNISDALSHGTTTGTSYTESSSNSTSVGYSKSSGTSESVSRVSMRGALAKTVGAAALGAASIVTAPLTGGASIAAAAAISVGQIGLAAYNPSTKTSGTTSSEGYTNSESKTSGTTSGTSESLTESKTTTRGLTSGTSENMQLTMQNKTLINMLDRIDQQLKRIDECESLGMWECAAYFLSESQETAEMAAGTYKSLMKGIRSGLETSAVNYWGRKDAEKLPLLKEYITNFLHPMFAYTTENGGLPVTAASLVSSNELAIEMGLPRKSVCGFPVIEHADFGREVVSYNRKASEKDICLGHVFNMGSKMKTKVNLDVNSLTMHTFVTGSTGSGKSNTVYEILHQLHCAYGVPFLVIEPAKGEYRDVFGGNSDVSVFGTNPKKAPLLQLNPFSFPDDTHVLEHIDRLVEVFNACWPMFAAMPAVLKASIEMAYTDCGWDLQRSEHHGKQKNFPTFRDVMKALPKVVDTKGFSNDTQGDYKGALLTRLESLTNGINGQVLCAASTIKDELLFDKSVIIDLSRVGSQETKALLMGILVLKLQEYRMSKRAEGGTANNSGLKHITVLEEAHNLLRRTSAEQSQESANLQGKSVEMLTNAIAEMRTYGEGFIIADQAPGLLDMAVIRNTNTKIILRLPDESDRTLVGKAAGLNDDQIIELSRLDTGVAAVYQNHWLEPVLCKVSEFKKEQQMPFTYVPVDTDSVQEGSPRMNTYFEKILNAPVTGELTCEDVDTIKNWIEYLPVGRNTKLQLLSVLSPDENIEKLNRGEILYRLANGNEFLKYVSDKTDREAACDVIDQQIMEYFDISRQLAEQVRQALFLYAASRIDQVRFADQYSELLKYGNNGRIL